MIRNGGVELALPAGMHITLATLDVDIPDHTRAYAEYRLFSCLSRHDLRVRTIEAVIRLDAARRYFRCLLSVDLGPAGRIKTQARRRNVTEAIDCAANRLGWLVERRMQQLISS